MMSDYNPAVVRKLLQAAFTADELRRFCQDRPVFGPVLVDAPTRASLNEIADVLIPYCTTNRLLHDLCAAVKEVNHRQYERFEPDLHSPYELPARLSGLHLGAPMQAPPLPAHFIPRPEVSDALKARLLAEEESAPGVLVVSAIQGLGGIGKSVLAAALAHDPEVHARFPDGVLWVTLGQQPELHSLLSDWIVNGLRDYNYRPTTVETASAHLRTLLLDKAALLVVDDVWEPEHARAFLVGSSCCRVLITTRRADVAEDVGSDLHQIDVMKPSQSLELLSARLGRPLEGKERQDAQRLARRMGHLPLALELAAARVSRSTSWADLCTALEEEVARLEALDSARRRRKRATHLEAVFNLSLDALRAEDEEAWEAFVWLGVLPEDVTITAAMARTLWDIEEAEASDLLELLWNDALLLLNSQERIGEGDQPGYRLHDLLHDMARRLLALEKPDGLGFGMAEAHAAVLEKYQTRTQDGLWHTLPADGYIHSHLTWHLVQAGQDLELHALLREETEEGRNGWYEARERLGQTAGYLVDLDRAWRSAEMAMATGLQCRYALISASLNTIAKNIPVELLEKVLIERIWSPAQALDYVRLIPSALQRSEALIVVIPFLTQSDRDDVVQKAVAALFAIHPNQEYAYRERLRALLTLIPFLPHPALHQALISVLAFQEPVERAQALIALAPLLPTKKDKELALHEAAISLSEITAMRERIQTLTNLLPFLSREAREAELSQALRSVQAIENLSKRLGALVDLLPCMPQTDRTVMERKVRLQIKKADLPRQERLHLLTDLSSHSLTDDEAKISVDEALSIVRDSGSPLSGTYDLSRLSPYLSHEDVEIVAKEILSAIQSQKSQRHIDAILQLVPHLSRKLIGSTLSIIREINGPEDRALALTAVAPLVKDSDRKIVVQEALDAIRDFSNEDVRCKAFANLIAVSVEEEREAMIQGFIESLEGRNWGRSKNTISKRLDALKTAAPYLKGHSLDRAVSAAVNLPLTGHTGSPFRARAIAVLLPYLSRVHIRAVLAGVRHIEDDEKQTDLLAHLMPLLSADLQRSTVMHLMENIRNQVEDGRTSFPTTLFGCLSDILWTNYSEFIYDNANFWSKAHLSLYCEIIDHAPQAELGKLLRAVRQIERDVQREAVLSRLAPQLHNVGLIEEALEVAAEIENTHLRLKTVSALASFLREPDRTVVLREAIIDASTIESNWHRADAIKCLASILPYSLLDKALNMAMEIEDPLFPPTPMAAIAQRLAELGHTRDAITLALRCRHQLTTAIFGIMPYLSETEQTVAMESGLHTIRWSADQRYQGMCLIKWAPCMPESLTSDAIDIAMSINPQQDLRGLIAKSRDEALSALFTRCACFGDYDQALIGSNDISNGHIRNTTRARIMVEVAHMADATGLLQILQSDGKQQGWNEAIITLAPNIPEDLTGSFLSIVERIAKEDERAKALAAMVPHLTGDSFSNALVIARRIASPRFRVIALGAFLPSISESEWANVLGDALAAIQEINPFSQSRALAELVPYLVTIPAHRIHPLLQRAIPAFASHSRETLLSDIQELIPVLEKVGGEEAIAEIFHAVQEVGRWWP